MHYKYTTVFVFVNSNFIFLFLVDVLSVLYLSPLRNMTVSFLYTNGNIVIFFFMWYHLPTLYD